MGLSGTLMFFIWTTNKNYGFQSRKTFYTSLTILLGILALFVFIVTFIRVLGFMTNPNIHNVQKSFYQDTEAIDISEMKGFYTHFDNETGNMVANFIFPEYDIILNDLHFDWDTFGSCAGRGVQTRIQEYSIGDFSKFDFHFLLHVSYKFNPNL